MQESDDAELKVDWNDGQKKVLSHGQGPLLVVAGAGTGKTRVIVGKINKLLDEGIQPSAILAVTFTEKAASEMEERVLTSRPGLLLDLPIMTFNGFGDSVLREYGINIGVSRSYRLLTAQAAIVFLRERFDLLNLNYFYPAVGSPDGIIEDILKYFSKLKQHLVTTKKYLDYADKLPAGSEAEKEDRRMHQELANAFSAYVGLCREANVVDFDDQIYLTIELLEKRPNVRKILQERFHTVFVDEFQDTNPMQSRLIDLIIPISGNLIVVGDDDQAIYGFRGATISNILNFKKKYSQATSVALTTNYRSHQSILDVAYKLIQNNNPHRLEANLGINKQLTSDRPGSKPQLLHFTNTSQELDWIARDIEGRLEQLKEGEQASIAVLARSNNSAQDVHRILSTFNIPHRVVGLNPDLYERPIIRTILELVTTIIEPGNNISLQHTLNSELFNINNEIIAPLANKASREHEVLEDLLENISETKQAIGLIRELRKESASESVGRLLWKAITETDLTRRLLDNAQTDDVAANALGHLTQFFDTLKEFENIATQPTVIQYQLALPALKAAGETTDSTMDLNENEVIVTTVHKAKGLEWNTVYLPQLTMQKFPMYKQGGGIELPTALRAESLSEADEHYSEERRVMYVGVTRARQSLILSYSDGSRKPSMFLNEMFGEEAVSSLPHTIVDEGHAHLQIPVDTTPKRQIPYNIYDGSTVTLDVTHAQTLLHCPLNFYYKYVIQTPREPSAAADIGTLMHGFIEEINKARRDNKTLRPLAEMTFELEKCWNKAGYISKVQRERRLAVEVKALANFYNQALESPPPIKVEDEFRVNLSDDLVLYGRIDAVFDHDGIEIRDYKTGFAAKTQEQAQKNVTDSRQLELYALAWLIKHDEMPAKLSLHYIDTDLIGTTTRKQLKTLEARRLKLIEAAENLKQGLFPPGSTHRHCVHPEIN